MRTLVAAAAVFVCLQAIGTAQAHVAADQPRIRLLDPAPLTLRGVDFDAWEQIRLVVKLGDRTVIRKLQATSTGSFTSRFPTMRYNRCSGSLEVTANGRKGSRVSWELIPLECPTTIDD